MKILAFDTSAKVSTVSIVDEEKVIAEYSINLNFTHSQTIMPMCEEILKQTKISLNEIDAFAVCVGPGSFTGLRIGISAIKGMSYALNKPCIEIKTLDALSYNMLDFDGIICSVMDARCNQVYNCIYENNGGNLEKITEDRAIILDDLLEELKEFKKVVILVGDGADLCYNKFKDALPNIKLASVSNRYQRASSVGLLAVNKFKQGLFVDACKLMPKYLRLPQAQRELMAKNNNKWWWKGDLMIAIGCDHGGLSLKNEIIKYFKENNIEYKDFGTYTEESCDYPDIASLVCNSINSKECDKGVLICGTGIGISMAANKIKGIRCALCHDYFSAKYTRLHNDSNIIAFGARVIGHGLALELLNVFLNTEFEGGRHQIRVNKMMELENK